jgi:CRISPR-associated endonuclease Csn1
MKEKNRSAAEMVLAEFPDAQRNKAGRLWQSAIPRPCLAELALLFQRQREFVNPMPAPNSKRRSLAAATAKAACSGSRTRRWLVQTYSRCSANAPSSATEYRAPKASFTAERHVWLTRLNNLRIVVDGSTRALNEAEHRAALPLPYSRQGISPTSNCDPP